MCFVLLDMDLKKKQKEVLIFPFLFVLERALKMREFCPYKMQEENMANVASLKLDLMASLVICVIAV